MSDRDLGMEMGTSHGRAAPPVIRLLLRRLEALLGERQRIIRELEMFDASSGFESRLLGQRLMKVTYEQSRVLEELDALVGVVGENAAPAAGSLPADEPITPTPWRGCADTIEESPSTLPPAPRRV